MHLQPDVWKSKQLVPAIPSQRAFSTAAMILRTFCMREGIDLVIRSHQFVRARLQGLRDNMKMENWHAHGFSTCLSSERIRKSWSGARGWGKSNFSGSYCTTLIIFSALSESVGQNSECEWFRSCTEAIWLPFSQLAPLLMLSEHQPRANLTCVLSMALWKLSRVPLGWWRGVPPWIDKRW